MQFRNEEKSLFNPKVSAENSVTPLLFLPPSVIMGTVKNRPPSYRENEWTAPYLFRSCCFAALFAGFAATPPRTGWTRPLTAQWIWSSASEPAPKNRFT